MTCYQVCDPQLNLHDIWDNFSSSENFALFGLLK